MSECLDRVKRGYYYGILWVRRWTMIEPINHGEDIVPIRMRADALKVLILIKWVIRLLQSGTINSSKLAIIKALQLAFKRAGLGHLDISGGGDTEMALDRVIRKLALLLDRVRELDSPDLQLSVVDPLVFDPTVTKSIMVELSSQMTGPVVGSAMDVPATITIPNHVPEAREPDVSGRFVDAVLDDLRQKEETKLSCLDIAIWLIP